MNLKFQILWIEDTKEWVHSLEQGLKDHFLENGFVLDLRWLPNSNTFEDASSNPDLDLILIDQNLPGMKGEDIVKAIRARDVYVDIVFYSQGQDTRKFAPNQDGVYYRERGDVDTAVR